jgi:hypothetical protein
MYSQSRMPGQPVGKRRRCFPKNSQADENPYPDQQHVIRTVENQAVENIFEQNNWLRSVGGGNAQGQEKDETDGVTERKGERQRSPQPPAPCVFSGY